MRKLNSHGRSSLSAGLRPTLGALVLGTAFAVASCAPAPVDMSGGSTAKGGSSGSSSSGGSSGSSGGSSGSGSGGSSGSNPDPSGSGGSSGSSKGGSAGSSSGSSGGSSGSSTKTGGTSGSSSTGGTSGSGTPDAGGGAETGGGTPSAATFSDIYDTILKPTCAGAACHGAAAGHGTPPIKMADKMMAYDTLMTRITAGKPAMSKLITEITPKAGKAPMPKNMPPLMQPQIDKITAWIMAGAKND